MENRTTLKDVKSLARDAQDTIQETATEWMDKTKAAGTAAFESAQAAYRVAQSKAVAGAKATDVAIRENPYRSLGIAFGVGLLLGFLIKRR